MTVRSAEARVVEGGRPPLAPEREHELVAAAQRGDTAARAALVEAYLPRIAAVARHYRLSPNVERAELLQEGVAGLLRALQRYDPARELPFWAYARSWVRQSMQRLVAELTPPSVLSDRALRRLSRIRDAYRALDEEHGREPATGELAQRTGLTHDQVAVLLAVDRSPRSTEEPLTTEDGIVWGRFEDLVIDPLAEGDCERVLDAIEAQELVALLSALSERDRKVLEEPNAARIAERLGVSTERVRQIARRARGKLAATAPDDARRST